MAKKGKINRLNQALEKRSMAMEFIVITNNPLVEEKYADELNVDYADIPFRDVLCKVRDLVHKGHRLLTHPLSGSVKPHETPYKSVLVSARPSQMDLGEVSIIENAIITADKFAEKFPNMPQSVKEDFQLIDCTLITSGIDAVLRR
jgi:hypothetical protein